jgi:hypothetical protein
MIKPFTIAKISIAFLFVLLVGELTAQAPSFQSGLGEVEQAMDIKFQDLVGVKHLLIGFKKDEGAIGSTYLLNSKGETIHRQENFEMAIYPAYNAIDISKYKPGTYTILIVSGKNNRYEAKVTIE